MSYTLEELEGILRNLALKVYEVIYEDVSAEYRELIKECHFATYNVGLPYSYATPCIKKDNLLSYAIDMYSLMEALYRISYTIKNGEKLCSQYIDHVKQLIKYLAEHTDLESVQQLLRKINAVMEKVAVAECKEEDVREMIKKDKKYAREEFNYDEFYYGSEEYSRRLSRLIDEDP